MEKLIPDEKPVAGVCKFCGNARPLAAKTGRPRRYCGSACHKNADWKIRWTQKRIEAIEANLAWARRDPLMAALTNVELEKADLGRLNHELTALLAD